MKKNLLLIVYALNIAITIGFWWYGNASLLTASASDKLLALGRLAGFMAAISVMTQYTLMSTAPWVEQSVGRGKLRLLHMRNGRLTYILIILHVLLIVGAYQGATVDSLWSTYWYLYKNLPFVWLASVALWILTLTVGISLDFIRNRLPYRIWHTIHLLNYTILGLIIWHQLANGGDLLANQIFRAYWTLLNTAAYFNLLYFAVFKTRLWSKISASDSQKA